MNPRLFGIAATRAPIVAILRRGPSDWSQVSRWDTAAGSVEPGAWIRANLYPQRCDLSADGRWFAYFTLRASARWAVGPTYVAVSRLPWLTALAAWGTGGTWTRGIQFTDHPRVLEVGRPDQGDIEPLGKRHRFGLEWTRPISFAVERRRGWSDAPGSPPYDRERDPWDERRARSLVIQKPRPGGSGGSTLTVRGWFAAFRSGQPSWAGVTYAIVGVGEARSLDGVQWADWDSTGRLLVATTDGRLEVRHEPWDRTTVDWSFDLGGMRPEPMAPPAVASRWT